MEDVVVRSIDSAALQRLLHAYEGDGHVNYWEVWTEEGAGCVKTYRFFQRTTAEKFYRRKWVAKVLCDPLGREVRKSCWFNPCALVTLRRRLLESRQFVLDGARHNDGSGDRADALRVVQALEAINVCETVDETRHQDLMESVAAKIERAFEESEHAAYEPSTNGVRTPPCEGLLGESLGQSQGGVLERAIFDLTNIDPDRLIDAMLDALRREEPEQNAMQADQLRCGTQTMRHPSYGENMLRPESLRNLINAADAVFREEVQESVHRISVPERGRLVIVGDTHGQVQDVLWMFFKYGRPSRSNVYLFNGDLVDRGAYSVEILILVMAFKLYDRSCIFVNRGNHEDEAQTTAYGFENELKWKFGPGWDTYLHNKFLQFFYSLPLCTVVRGAGISQRKKVAVLHGGVPTVFGKMEAVDLRDIAKISRGRPLPMMRRLGCVEDADQHFICLLWSDPRDWPENDRSEHAWWPDGPARRRGLAFGPAATAAFLAKNNLDLVVRSHEVPGKLRGFEVMHGGKLCTVFSASNYCGSSLNNGGVILWDAQTFPSLLHRTDVEHALTLAEHWAVPLNSLVDLMTRHQNASLEVRRFVAEQAELKTRSDSAEFLVTTPEVIEGKVVQYVKTLIVAFKPELWRAFEDVCDRGDYFVSCQQWADVCARVMGSQFPWSNLQNFLVGPRECNEVGDCIHFAKFLARYTVVYQNEHELYVGWQRQVLVTIFSHFLKQDLPMLEAIKQLDRDGDGYVTCSEFQQALHDVGAAITRTQAGALLRTLERVADVEKGIPVADFLSLFSAGFAGHRRWASDDEELEWVPLCLEWIGTFVRRRSGAQSLLDVFRQADTDSNGYLELHEFKSSFAKVLSGPGLERQIQKALVEEEAATSGEDNEGTTPLESDPQLLMRLDQIARYLDATKTGHISLLEFMSAFAPKCTEEMRMDILEQICVTILNNRHAVRLALRRFDQQGLGKVQKSRLRDVLEKLNEALDVGAGKPLADIQIRELVASLGGNDGSNSHEDLIDYNLFLDSFEYVDIDEVDSRPDFLRMPTAKF